MKNEEFSNQFSSLLNSYGSIAQFGEQASRQEITLDEYEKSVFLTQAQDILVKSYFDAVMNSEGKGFDDSSRRQADFSSLIRVEEMDPLPKQSGTLYDVRSLLFKLPVRSSSKEADSADVLLILNEKLLKMRGSSEISQYVIKPISYLEYDREMSKPYTKPLKKQAWRLFQNTAVGFDILSEVIPREDLSGGEAWKYRVRYVKRPQPIILENLPDGLSIDGISEFTECELHPIMHYDILMKAVELAYFSRTGVRATENKQPVQTAR